MGALRFSLRLNHPSVEKNCLSKEWMSSSHEQDQRSWFGLMMRFEPQSRGILRAKW